MVGYKLPDEVFKHVQFLFMDKCIRFLEKLGLLEDFKRELNLIEYGVLSAWKHSNSHMSDPELIKEFDKTIEDYIKSRGRNKWGVKLTDTRPTILSLNVAMRQLDSRENRNLILLARGVPNAVITSLTVRTETLIALWLNELGAVIKNKGYLPEWLNDAEEGKE